MYTYRNPIISGFNSDPSICRKGKDFYLVTSSFEYFPGVPIYHSTNLVNWQLISYCLDREEQIPLHNCPPSKGIFAPTIRYHDGYFFMTTININTGENFIVHTRDPKKAWSNPLKIDQDGIDPDLLFAEDGSVYFTSTGIDKDDRQLIQSCRINPFTGEKLSPSCVISYGCGGVFPEGPHLYEIDHKYYLMIAEGGTEYNHRETIQVSDHPFGPFKKYEDNPIIKQTYVHKRMITCAGHADLVDDMHGNWWLVCLAVRPIGTPHNGVMLHNLGRETFLSPLKWENGWPHVAHNGVLQLQMEAPLPEKPEPVCRDFVDDFTQKELSVHYNYLRNPEVSQYQVNTKKHQILLKGTSCTLNDLASPTWLGIRQKDFYLHAQVSVQLPLQGQTGRVGLSAYYDNDYHYDLYLTAKDGSYAVEVAKKVHDIFVVTASVPIASDSVTLHIRADKEAYQFYYEYDGKKPLYLDKGCTAGLCTEGTRTMTFTGTFIALFAEQVTGKFTHFAVTYQKEDSL